MRKTKIVCTIGPACESEEMIGKMILAGMNVARLNFSHGTHESHKAVIERIKKVRAKLSMPVGILLDTKGPEIRTKELPGGSAELIEGEEFTLSCGLKSEEKNGVAVTLKNLYEHLKPGDTVLLDDGLIELKVKDIAGENIICSIVSGGILGNHKGINLPGISFDMPYMNEKDKNDILFGIENDVDFIALSFVRTVEDIETVQKFLRAYRCYDIELIAKIENMQGVKNIDSIINASNGIMVARGDMGVEIPFEELPHIQKTIIKACYSAGKKVITATQMLESMVSKPRPTRAEITDVANAIYDGTSALMLSGETAMGNYPLKAVETMVKIAEKTESDIDYETYMSKESSLVNLAANIPNAISHATCTTARDLKAAAILAVTLSGKGARYISRFRPAVPIIAVTPYEKVYQQLSLAWGIYPIKNTFIENSHELFNDVISKSVASGYVKSGDLVVVTGSTQHSTGMTNTLQVHIIDDQTGDIQNE
ncbi:pyruvate kinase [Holotrichia oblita]|nr:pyruvate kinase [Holotrichia oblita]